MTVLHTKPHGLTTDRLEVHFVFAMAFFVFLAAVAVGRLLPRRMRFHVANEGKRLSIIREARALTETYMPFAFL